MDKIVDGFILEKISQFTESRPPTVSEVKSWLLEFFDKGYNEGQKDAHSCFNDVCEQFNIR